MLIRGRVLGLEFECVFLIRSVTCWQLNWIRALAKFKVKVRLVLV